MVDSSTQRGARSPFRHIGRECGFVRWGIRARYVALSLLKLTSLWNCCSALKIGFCATDCFVMRSTADNYASQTAVDIFNVATGMWSTAQLSLQRRAMGVTSVGNIALFAGGGVADGTFCTEWQNLLSIVWVSIGCACSSNMQISFCLLLSLSSGS
jgi:hypothetical protein